MPPKCLHNTGRTAGYFQAIVRTADTYRVRQVTPATTGFAAGAGAPYDGTTTVARSHESWKRARVDRVVIARAWVGIRGCHEFRSLVKAECGKDSLGTDTGRHYPGAPAVNHLRVWDGSGALGYRCTRFTDPGGSGHHWASKCLTRVHLYLINTIISI
jgi:hypothetical protein